MKSNCKIVSLSHFISEETPSYGNRGSLKREKISDLCLGDGSNSERLIFGSHLSTHIDFPRHFFLEGKTCDQYSPEFWFFKFPFVIDVSSRHAGELIQLSLQELNLISRNTDLLLLKTGFESFRGEEIYWKNNPGIHPSMASAIRKHLPNVRVIGFDFISLSAFQSREIGRDAHRQFLCQSNSVEPILILEDVKLSLTTTGRLEWAVIAPLLIKNGDGVPCTVFAGVSC